MRAKHLALLAVALVAFAVSPVRASCAAPEVSIRPTTAAPGDTLVVQGRYWDDICDDTGGGTCFGNDGFDSRPTQDIAIRLQPPKGEAIELAEADADDELRFTVEVQLPDDLLPGRYRVLAGSVRSDALTIEHVGEPEQAARLSRAAARRKALIDGQIDRREAIRLATVHRGVAPRLATARPGELSGRSVWEVEVDDPACYYLVTIEAKTGRALSGTVDCD